MDERLRAAGHAARAEVEAVIDVDAAWHEVTARCVAGDNAGTHGFGDHRPGRSQRWLVGAAAAALAALVLALAVVAGRSDNVGIVPATVPATRPESLVTPTPPPPTIGSAPAVPRTTVSPPTASLDSDLPTIAVSYRTPPPESALRPIGSFAYAAPDQTRPQYAVGENGVVIAYWQSSISVMGWDGVVREVGPFPDVTGLQSPIAGPGDILYARDASRAETVAIALSGDRQGEIVARSPDPATAEPLHLVDIRNGFVHGPTGVVYPDAVNGDVELIAYVDETGSPRPWVDAPRSVPREELVGEPPTVNRTWRVHSGDTDWLLDIERDPGAEEPFNGFGLGLGLAPGPGGTVVRADTIGPALAPEEEFSDNSLPVVAMLQPDGAGSWRSVPPSWRYEAASPWGVLVSRVDTTNLRIDLALLDL